MSTDFFLSVIIPTRNRNPSLSGLLSCLSTQSLSSDLFEIVVVDNASTDETRESLHQWKSELSNLRVVFEGRIGSNYARNAGVLAAKGALLAFIDDDCLPHPQWAERIIQSFKTLDLSRTCLVGKVLLDLPHKTPRWYGSFLENYLSQIDWGENPLTIEARKACSANLVIPREIFNYISGFDTRLNRTTSNLQSNDETLTLIQLSQREVQFHYEPSIKVFHQISSHRLNQSFLRKRAFWQGKSDVAMEIYLNGKKSAWEKVIWPSLYFLLKNPYFFLAAYRPCRGPKKFEKALRGQLFLGRSVGAISFLIRSTRGISKKNESF